VKTLVLANQKGGVGKSAVATLISHHLAQQGKRVLAIDFDHQGNFSKALRMSGRPAVAAVTADLLMTSTAVPMPQKPFVLVQNSQLLLGLERQPDRHTPFAKCLRAFLEGVGKQFDACVIDTHPNPDIRVIAALASADLVLSPVQLTQEAFDGVTALLTHPRAGVRKIKEILNPKLELIGLLPSMVEQTPFQRENFKQVIASYLSLLVRTPGGFACIPRRSVIAEAQSEGAVLWEMKKTAARDAWREIEASISTIADVVLADSRVNHAAAAA